MLVNEEKNLLLWVQISSLHVQIRKKLSLIGGVESEHPSQNLSLNRILGSDLILDVITSIEKAHGVSISIYHNNQLQCPYSYNALAHLTAQIIPFISRVLLAACDPIQYEKKQHSLASADRSQKWRNSKT